MDSEHTTRKPDQETGRKDDLEASIDSASPEAPAAAETESAASEKVREIGGRKGPDPTRYGDWEKGGRCIDF